MPTCSESSIRFLEDIETRLSENQNVQKFQTFFVSTYIQSLQLFAMLASCMTVLFAYFSIRNRDWLLHNITYILPSKSSANCSVTSSEWLVEINIFLFLLNFRQWVYCTQVLRVSADFTNYKFLKISKILKISVAVLKFFYGTYFIHPKGRKG